jgi:uncharacterized membrane protein
MRVSSLTLGGIILGMGLGGFFDGIVFHQVLQWHHLVCVTEHCQPRSIEHLQQQNRQDGYFHVATLALTTLGSYRVFWAARLAGPGASAAAFAGPVLAGWGLFNFVEGLVNHQLLAIHHVAPGSRYEFAADLLFLASGLLLMLVGRRLTLTAMAPAISASKA